MSTATAQDKRVEDLSQRTASTVTYANPNGSWTTEAYSGLVRSPQDERAWVPIDPTLGYGAAGFEPGAVPFDVSYSDGQDKKIATVSTDDGAALTVKWPEQLPAAEAEGDTLTYRAAANGADLVVTSRPDGFNFSVLLDEAPAEGATQLEYRFPIHVGDGNLVAHPDGSLEVKKGGEIIAALTPPIMWDSSEQAPRVAVNANIEGSGADRVLVLTPDMGFLLDPKTVYPVTVDPTLVLTTTGDTWVQSLLNGGSQDTSPELQVGSNNLGVNKFRSYANFDISALTSKPGAVVSSASFQFSNFTTGSCAGTAIRVSRVTSAWSVPGLTWNTQPTTTPAGESTSTDAYGASGCATETKVAFDATTIVNDWQAGASNFGIQVKADNESANTGYRKYRSLENGDSAKAPKLSITYNTPPSVPSYNLVTPAGAVGSTFHTRDTKPTFSTTPIDADGGQVTTELRIIQGGATVQSWTSGPGASGAAVSHKLTTALPEGAYSASWRVSDGLLTSAWSPDQAFNVDLTAPATPQTSCTNYANNSWQDPRPTGGASTACTITVSADSQWAAVHDGHEWINVPPLNNNTTSFSFPVPADSTFGFWVVASDVAGNWATSTFTFGVGDGGFYSPENGSQFAGPLQVNAGAPSGAYGAVLNWRKSGSTTWTEATEITKAGQDWNGGVDTAGAISRTGDLIWQADAEIGIMAPATLEIQACFSYWTAPTQRCGKTRQVTLVEHAFGGSYPTSTVGPAEVALLTGEYQVSAGDVSVPGYRTTLSMGRTFQSLGGPVTAAESVFGPGWTANLQGPSWGFAGGQVVDTTGTDGTIQLLDHYGDSSVYKLAGPAAQAVGVYEPQGETMATNSKLEIKVGTPKTLELTESDGTITTWTHASGTSHWKVSSVTEPSTAPATNYAYNGDYVTGMYSAPVGVTCNATTQNRGCRGLQLSYTGAGASTRLTQVDLRTWDPKPGVDGASTTAAAMVTIPVAKYSYDASNRLEKAWDPRLDYGSSQHVATTYGYQTIGGKAYLASITPPGEKAWTFTLDATTGMFEGATRDQDAAVGGTATWNVKYDVPVSGAGLPDLTADTAKAWGQRTAPTRAAAVFGPDALGTNDYTYANLTHFTSEGVTTNSASYGAGEWLINTIEYDELDNPVWSLPAVNRAARLKDNWTGNQIRAWGGNTNTYSADGTRIETETSPLAWLTKKDGNGIVGARATRYVYDDEAASADMPGRPAEWTSTSWPKRNILIKSTTTVDDAWGIAAYDPETTWNRYQPVVAGDGNGWVLGQPTRVSTSMGSGWSTTLTRFDSDGRVLERRTPQGVDAVDGAGSDARSRIASYYTADGSASQPACRNRPEWVDAVCTAGPAGGSTPSTTTAGLDYLGTPTRVVETTGSTQRVRITTTDGAGRPTKTSLAAINAPAGQQAVPDVTIAYENATGRRLSTTSGGQTSTIAVDTWGRTQSQTDGNGNTATTTYNAAGRVATFADGKGTYTYTWDGTDANGKAERRGLLTRLDVGLSTGPDQFDVAYDAAGAETKLVYPNGVVRARTYDQLGNELTRLYETSSGADLTAWTNYYDRDGRIRVDVTVGGNIVYNYDDRGRLVKVADTYWGQCTTREYAFSLDSNRTSLTTWGPGTNGACQTSSPSSTKNSTFDGEDKLVDSGYVYDILGRTSTLPAADTTSSADGDVSVAYYANDLVRSLTRPGAAGGAQAKTWSLDALGRLAGMSSTTAGAELRKTTSHYSDSSDAPAWIEESIRPDPSSPWSTTWTRNVLGPNGELAVSQASDGTSRIQITNPHGDVVSTMTNSPSVTGLENYSEASEYGLQKSQFTPLNQAYGWLGGHRRSTDSLGGLVLMGVRLYNPVTGRFLSRDPIYGGNDNAYVYPPDPVGMLDTSGFDCKDAGWEAERTGRSTWSSLPEWGEITLADVRAGLNKIGDLCDGASCAIYVLGVMVPLAYYDSATARKYRNNNYGIYGIYSLKEDGTGPPSPRVWKYGITMQGAVRPRSQLRKCRADTGRDCEWHWVGFARGYYNARMIETGYTIRYILRHGKCPPGMPACK